MNKTKELKRLRSERAKLNHQIRRLSNPKAYSETQRQIALSRERNKKKLDEK